MAHIDARKGILDMAPYNPGKSEKLLQTELGVSELVKLMANENPMRTSKKALDAMHAELDRVYQYPESSSPELRDALAKKFSLTADNFIMGTGGDHIISLLANAFVNEGEEVIVPDPSFPTYDQATLIMGGKLVKVAVRPGDLTMDLDKMLHVITDKTKLVFLCNPNNPTATIVGRQAVADFMQSVPDHVLVVFDEAYHEFVSDADYPDGMEYVRADRNVLVIRTFSKVYGLAGLRIGYGVAPKRIIDVLGRVTPVFPANRIAQAGALAALEDDAFLEEARRVTDEGRSYLCKHFDAMGMRYAQSRANFLFVDIGMDAGKAAAAFMKEGILLKPGGGWGFPTFLRVSIGAMPHNERFIAVLKALYDQNKA